MVRKIQYGHQRYEKIDNAMILYLLFHVAHHFICTAETNLS